MRLTAHPPSIGGRAKLETLIAEGGYHTDTAWEMMGNHAEVETGLSFLGFEPKDLEGIFLIVLKRPAPETLEEDSS